MREFKLGRIGELNLSAMPSALASFIVLWIGLVALTMGLLKLSWASAIVVGFIATGLHWLSETIHQFGHAAFARRTGYPMTGIRYWGALSASVYPDGEPALSGTIHVRRALGGPVTSLLVAVVGGLILLALSLIAALSGVWWLALFFVIENVAVFCLGALLPLGFTDGSTLLRWGGKP